MRENQYEAARNKLIPEAEQYAYAQHGPRPDAAGVDRDTWVQKWNRTFLQRMDYLARETGLIAKGV